MESSTCNCGISNFARINVQGFIWMGWWEAGGLAGHGGALCTQKCIPRTMACMCCMYLFTQKHTGMTIIIIKAKGYNYLPFIFHIQISLCFLPVAESLTPRTASTLKNSRAT